MTYEKRGEMIDFAFTWHCDLCQADLRFHLKLPLNLYLIVSVILSLMISQTFFVFVFFLYFKALIHVDVHIITAFVNDLSIINED